MTNIRNVSQLVDHKHDLKKGDSFKINDIKLYVTDADGINRWRKAFQNTNLDEADLVKEFNKVKDTFSSITEPHHGHHHEHGHHHHHHGHHHHDEHKEGASTSAPTTPRTEAAATTSTTGAEAHKPAIVVTPADSTPNSPRTNVATTTTTTTAAVSAKPTTHAPTPQPLSPRTDGAATTTSTAHVDTTKPAATTATTSAGGKPTTAAPNPPKTTNTTDAKKPEKPANHHNFWDSFKSGGEKVKEFFFGSHNRTAMTLITTAALGCVLLTRTHYFQSMFSKLMQNVKSHFGK